MRFGIGGAHPLYDGARIHLESQHGGTVRVNEDDEVDGHGKYNFSTFFGRLHYETALICLTFLRT